jgi:hypothetical protein
LLHIAESHQESRTEDEGENQQDPPKEEPPVLVPVAVHQESSKPDAACQLQAQGHVQKRKKEDLGGIEKVLVVAHEVKKEKENRNNEEERHGPARKTGQAGEKEICFHSKHFHSIERYGTDGKGYCAITGTFRRRFSWC